MISPPPCLSQSRVISALEVNASIMETDILKLILSNQGSMDTDELLCNLCDYASLTEIIRRNDKFVPCLLNLRPKVVVQSRLRLCWSRECAGCGGLHLCLRFLFSGSCQFSQLRRGCSFSHDLHSEYNLEVLRRFGLETLSRSELCLLLLQSNNTLLPQICRDYNNNCGCWVDCQRLHVCERYISCESCTCSRAHDFSASQPLRILQEKHIPDHLFKVLKSVYANKEALRLAEKRNRNDNSELNDTRDCTGYDSDSSSASAKQTSGRGKRGGRGRRGRRQTGAYGGQKRQERAPSRGDSQDNTNTDPDDETENDSSRDQNTTEGKLGDDSDSDSSSTIGTGNCNDYQGTKVRGRGGYRGHMGNRRGRGRQAASHFGGSTNESEASRRGNAAKFRGNSRGGRGNRGHRGGRYDKAEGVPFRSDLQEDKDDTEVSSSQDPTPSGDETSDKKQDSSFGGDGSHGARGKTNTASNFQPLHRASPGKTTDWSSTGPQRRQRDKTEICMFFIKGHCLHEDRCYKAHDKMPYRWEIKQDGKWTAMAENETIEKDFCNPENTYSTTSPPVHFDTMKCKSDEVRRLSTMNSVVKPDFIHTTDWLWYWEDEYGKWYQYAAVTSEHRLASITSKELEEMYMKNNKDVVTFTAGSQSYELSFQDMIQKNLSYGTKRLVRRRPRFVSAAEVQTKKKRPAYSTAVPDNWDKTLIPQIGFKRVLLQPSSPEYKEIQVLFSRTMAAFEVLTIERIQNKAVWEAFQLHKTHLKHKNGGRPVLEKRLFHGTEPTFVNTICETNFDWRVCGVHGTVYGQGSYFARDAKYSHDYTGDSDPRFMFVSRVLVGEFTKGSREYRRPPSRDGGDVNLFDSCVDDVFDPSIFVVFKEQQIYPEYLLQYKHSDKSNVYSQSYRQTTYTQYRTVPPPASYTPSPARPNPTPAFAPAPTPTPAPAATDNQNSCVIA